MIWPPYHTAALREGILTAREAHQVRACYGGKLTMIDQWFGRILDSLDRNDLWKTTGVFVLTDHGHYLGEKDIWGKPGVPVYEPLGHIPLMVAWPGESPREVDALTTSVDIHATLADIFGVQSRQRTHGVSLVPLIAGKEASVRDYALTGVWGREVHLLDGRLKYARAPGGPNAPISLWSNRWSTMPAGPSHLRLPPPDDRAFLDRMPGSKIPVIRQPFTPGDMFPYWAYGRFSGNHLYDLNDDPNEEHNLAGEKIEGDVADLLRRELIKIEAPDDQLSRLGLV